jgi:hypothetical protein
MVLTQLPEVHIQALGMLVRVQRGAHLALLGAPTQAPDDAESVWGYPFGSYGMAV